MQDLQSRQAHPSSTLSNCSAYRSVPPQEIIDRVAHKSVHPAAEVCRVDTLLGNHLAPGAQLLIASSYRGCLEPEQRISLGSQGVESDGILSKLLSVSQHSDEHTSSISVVMISRIEAINVAE